MPVRLVGETPALNDPSAEFPALKQRLWPGSDPIPDVPHACDAPLLRMYPAGQTPRAGSLCSSPLDVDSHWHFHDMHQVIYAFEGAIEVEVEAGRHLIPRQLAAWIPAGLAHRASLRRVRSVVVFLPRHLVPQPGRSMRVLLAGPLLREMMREAMRWQLHGADSPLRSAFFQVVALFCGEWIADETDLFLPSCRDARLRRALDFTAAHSTARLAEVCASAGMSERSLRRHFKAETGMTWEAYRQRSRLLEAIALLGETAAPIGDIAARCGFDSASAFARAFRAAVGEAPSAYRRKSRAV